MNYFFIFLIGLFFSRIAISIARVFPIYLNSELRSQCIDYLGKEVSLKKDDFNFKITKFILSVFILKRKDLISTITLPFIWIGLTFVFNDFNQIILVFVFSFISMTLFLIDYNNMILPDEITLPFIWIGLLSNIYGHLNITIQSAVLGAIAGYFILWIIYWIFKIITGKDGIGYGDFKLLAAIGAWVGLGSIINVIIISSFLGLLILILLKLFLKKSIKSQIPFGPSLCIAGLITLIDNQIHFINF